VDLLNEGEGEIVDDTGCVVLYVGDNEGDCEVSLSEFDS
jgi:hypothetical protein